MNSRSQDDIYYRAYVARDHRFDGKFFIAVKTTGIYCRPICSAKPMRKNVEFFPDAISAEKAGYRPCLRCRPECAPTSAAWIGKSAVVRRALRLISHGGPVETSEDRFADQFGVSARHLRQGYAAIHLWKEFASRLSKSKKKSKEKEKNGKAIS
jgi:AraC family transcriptional regulator, regulatory protein of adaptative response / DNA-3-methyladenine glycosylase II